MRDKAKIMYASYFLLTANIVNKCSLATSSLGPLTGRVCVMEGGANRGQDL